jgi:hypothetical protein
VAAPWSWYSISQFLDALLKRIDERIGLRGLCVLFGNDLCQICSPEPKGLKRLREKHLAENQEVCRKQRSVLRNSRHRFECDIPKPESGLGLVVSRRSQSGFRASLESGGRPSSEKPNRDKSQLEDVSAKQRKQHAHKAPVRRAASKFRE